ncbi:MAG: hypothetical protein AB7O56_01530 [Bauldia sp.]
MRKLVALASALAMVPAVANAQASDAARADALTQCLLTNTTTVEEGMVRNMLVALFEEDVPVAQTYLIGLFAQIQTLATGSCNAPEDFRTAAWSQTVPQAYINAMLSEAFRDALALLATPPEGGAAPAGAAPAPGAAPATPAPPPPAPAAPVAPPTPAPFDLVPAPAPGP